MARSISNTFIYLSVIVVSILLSACSGSVSSNSGSSGTSGTGGSTYDTSSTEVISSAISNIATQSDASGGSIVALNESGFIPQKGSAVFHPLLVNILSAMNTKSYASTCSASAALIGAGCSGTSMSISLSGCTSNVGTWNGTVSMNYNSINACFSVNQAGLIGMGASNNVSITSSGITLTGAAGYSVVSDSNSSGYSSAVSGGTTIACGGTDCTTGRTVNILGLHRRLLNPNSVVLYDHSINTPTALAVSGSGANRQISSGSIRVQHNVAQFISTATITTPLTFTSGCCSPTGGSITTTFSGSKSGTETVTFGPTCGKASVGGNTVTLSYCQ